MVAPTTPSNPATALISILKPAFSPDETVRLCGDYEVCGCVLELRVVEGQDLYQRMLDDLEVSAGESRLVDGERSALAAAADHGAIEVERHGLNSRLENLRPVSAGDRLPCSVGKRGRPMAMVGNRPDGGLDAQQFEPRHAIAVDAVRRCWTRERERVPGPTDARAPSRQRRLTADRSIQTVTGA
jgi:hypothetical protein